MAAENLSCNSVSSSKEIHIARISEIYFSVRKNDDHFIIINHSVGIIFVEFLFVQEAKTARNQNRW